jgi:AcrR family transcriptional regulator
MDRPDTEAVTADAIAVAALGILDRDGAEALSFRRVATALGVSHTTVHRHCGNFDGLLDLCAEHLATGLPDVDPAIAWATATELRFTALYDILAAYSSLVALQRGRPWLGPQMMRRFSEPAVHASLATGMTFPEVVRAHRQLYMYTVGCALTSSSYDASAGRRALAVLDPAEFPVLTSHMNEFVDDASNAETFVEGLRHLTRALDPSRGVVARQR